MQKNVNKNIYQFEKRLSHCVIESDKNQQFTETVKKNKEYNHNNFITNQQQSFWVNSNQSRLFLSSR
jgi:hypothetical protein